MSRKFVGLMAVTLAVVGWSVVSDVAEACKKKRHKAGFAACAPVCAGFGGWGACAGGGWGVCAGGGWGACAGGGWGACAGGGWGACAGASAVCAPAFGAPMMGPGVAPAPVVPAFHGVNRARPAVARTQVASHTPSATCGAPAATAIAQGTNGYVSAAVLSQRLRATEKKVASLDIAGPDA